VTLLSVLVLAVALSLDSLGVGVAYGLRRIRAPWTLYLVVALCTGVLMGLSMAVGHHLSGFLTPLLARRAGGAVLIGVGLWQLYQGWTGYRQRLAPSEKPRELFRMGIRPLGLVVEILVEPSRADVDRSGVIETPESLALGLALGLDSLGAGFGAAMSGFGLAAVPAVAAACAAFVGLGLLAGRHPATEALVHKAFFLPGLLLMGIGLARF